MVVRDAPAGAYGNASCAPTRSAAARSSFQSVLSEFASRLDLQSLRADEVKQDQRLELAVVAPRVGLGAAQAGRRERPRVVRRLLPVEEQEADLPPHGRAVAPCVERAGELHDHGRARGAVVGADEVRDVLRVVVRGDRDRRLAAGDAADDVAQAWVAGDALEGAAREPVAQAHGEAPERVGARGARAELHLAHELLPRARGVEAVAEQALRRRRVLPAARPGRRWPRARSSRSGRRRPARRRRRSRPATAAATAAASSPPPRG